MERIEAEDKLRRHNVFFPQTNLPKYKIIRDKSDLLRERLLSRLRLDLLRLFSLLLLLRLTDLLLLLPFWELADLLLLLSLLTLADRLRSPIFRLQSQRPNSTFEFLKQLSMQMLSFEKPDTHHKSHYDADPVKK